MYECKIQIKAVNNYAAILDICSELNWRYVYDHDTNCCVLTKQSLDLDQMKFLCDNILTKVNRYGKVKNRIVYVVRNWR